MHVYVNEVWTDGEGHVDEVGVATLGLKHIIHSFNSSLNLIILNQPVINKQQENVLFVLYCIWLA